MGEFFGNFSLASAALFVLGITFFGGLIFEAPLAVLVIGGFVLFLKKVVNNKEEKKKVFNPKTKEDKRHNRQASVEQFTSETLPIFFFVFIILVLIIAVPGMN